MDVTQPSGITCCVEAPVGYLKGCVTIKKLDSERHIYFTSKLGDDRSPTNKKVGYKLLHHTHCTNAIDGLGAGD